MESRRFVVQGIFILIGLIFLIKLFGLQVADTSYQFKAERNIIQPIVEYPFRGLIYDRNKKPIVYNEPIYDLMVVPKDVEVIDTLAFCDLLQITPTEYVERLTTAREYSRVKPSSFLQKISHQEYARIQDKLYNYRGFFVNPRTVRRYTTPVLANELGYIAEIDPDELEQDSTGYYKSGDHIGKTGLEKSYETLLRGQRGVSYKMVNVNGIEKGSYKNGAYDTASVPGRNLVSTIDLDLQKYGESLMEGKRGSIVAIEPSSGEIIAMVSSPSYDPNDLTGRDFSKNYELIAADTTDPLFNRAIMAKYAPGSIFKTVQAMIALDKGLIRADEEIFCNVATARMGDHAASGYYDVAKGIEFSSNTYFYEVMRRVVRQGVSPNLFIDSKLGLSEWTESVRKFGFGNQLGIDIPGETIGTVPDTTLYNEMHGRHRWGYTGIYSLSIGQGELEVTPIQVANLAAIIANKGYYYTPHLVKGIEKNGEIDPLEFDKINVSEDTSYFPAIYEGMARAAKRAWRARISDIEILGKTGTVENGIKDESKDHSVFMAFAPREDPQIAIAVYVENAGWGAGAAAVTASLMIEKHLRGYIKNGTVREKFILDAEFLNFDIEDN